jgi:ribosomal protein S18 acetylase RimI-like enzyme
VTHKSNAVFRNFQQSDTEMWIRTHGIVSGFSQSWIFITNRKPKYKNEAIELVAEREDSIVGFIDVEIEPLPGALCLKADTRGGFVWEIGVLPEMQKKGVGKKLVKEAADRLAQRGIHRMEFFSRDPEAWKFYEKLQMEKISTHYQIFIKPTSDISHKLLKKGILNVDYIYATCWEDDLEEVSKNFEIMKMPPYEPHLCLGFEYRF